MTDNMNEQTTTEEQEEPKVKTFSEELEVAGTQLVDKVKELIEQGNVRRVIIRDPNDRVLIEIPLTIGVVAGGALAMFYPILAAVGALAALVARVKIEVVREASEDDDVVEGKKIDSPDDDEPTA